MADDSRKYDFNKQQPSNKMSDIIATQDEKDEKDGKKVGNSTFYDDSGLPQNTQDSEILGYSGRVMEESLNNDEKDVTEVTVVNLDAKNYVKQCLDVVAEEIRKLDLDQEEIDKNDKMLAEEFQKIMDVLYNKSRITKEAKKQTQEFNKVESNSPIIIKIKEFFSAILEFIRDPLNSRKKTNLLNKTNETKETIQAEHHNQQQNTRNSTAIIDNLEPRAVREITRRHSLSEVDDINRAAQHTQLLRSVSSPELTPANNKILTEKEESKHTWTELGKTPNVPFPNKEVIVEAARLVSAIVSPNESPAPDSPTPAGSPPIPSTPLPPLPLIDAEMQDHVKLERAETEVLLPPVKHSAAVREMREDTAAKQDSEMVSTSPATSLKAEPVVPVSSSSVPPAPPPPPDLPPARKEVGDMHNQPLQDALKGVRLKTGKPQSSDLTKDFKNELEAKLAKLKQGNIETGKTDKAPGGAAQRYLEDEQLFAQLAKEEVERQAKYKAIHDNSNKAQNTSKPVVEEIKQSDTTPPASNVKIVYDDTGRPIAPPPPSFPLNAPSPTHPYRQASTEGVAPKNTKSPKGLPKDVMQGGIRGNTNPVQNNLIEQLQRFVQFDGSSGSHTTAQDILKNIKAHRGGSSSRGPSG